MSVLLSGDWLSEKQDKHDEEKLALGSDELRFEPLTAPLPCCVTPGKLPSLSEPH